MTENEIGRVIIDCAYQVHKRLGPGLLESAYHQCLAYEIARRGLEVRKETGLPLIYDEIRMDCGYRVDLFVCAKVLVEVKSVEMLNDVHIAQILTYLKLSGCKLGFLINFNVALIKTGIKRLVRNLES